MNGKARAGREPPAVRFEHKRVTIQLKSKLCRREPSTRLILLMTVLLTGHPLGGDSFQVFLTVNIIKFIFGSAAKTVDLRSWKLSRAWLLVYSCVVSATQWGEELIYLFLYECSVYLELYRFYIPVMCETNRCPGLSAAFNPPEQYFGRILLKCFSLCIVEVRWFYSEPLSQGVHVKHIEQLAVSGSHVL